MAARRPLTAGINTLEGVDLKAAQAFIKQEPLPADQAEVSKSESIELSVFENDPDPQKNINPNRSSQRRSTKAKNKLVLVGLIPVTVRLRPEIAGALKRASLELQLQGEEPHTQQDLVEQCLEPWLRSNGFLSDTS